MIAKFLSNVNKNLERPLALTINPEQPVEFYSLALHPSIRDGQLEIFAPIPMYNTAEVLELLRHLPIPYPAANDIEIHTRGNNDIIAGEEAS